MHCEHYSRRFRWPQGERDAERLDHPRDCRLSIRKPPVQRRLQGVLAPDGLVAVETGAAATVVLYAPPEESATLRARGTAWMGLLPWR